MLAVPLIGTTMAAMVRKVVFVGEEQKEQEQSRLQGALPKNLIARLPVQVRLTNGVPEAYSPEFPDAEA